MLLHVPGRAIPALAIVLAGFLFITVAITASAQVPNTTEIEYTVYIPVAGPSAGHTESITSLAAGYSCLNVGDDSTDVTFVEYDTDGDILSETTAPSVDPYEPIMIFRDACIGICEQPVPSAVVVSGLQPLICSFNRQTSAGTLRVGSGSAMRGEDVAPTIYVTQIANEIRDFNSYVTVQNAGDEEVTVTATYYNRMGTAVATVSTDIPANAARVFDQHDGSLPTDFVGSARFVSSDGATPLAGVVTLYNTRSAQLLIFRPVTEGSNTTYMPRLVKNISGVGFTSGWACQNLGPGAADIEMRVSFRDQSDGTTKTFTLTEENVGVGQSWGGYVGSDPGFSDVERGFGGAVVESTGGQIACTVNEDNRNGGDVQPAFIGQGSTYNALRDGTQTNTVFFPQIVSLGVNSFRGGFQIVNTEGTSGSCQVTYSNGDVDTISVPAFGVRSIFAQNSLSNYRTSFNGSAVVECDVDIVGIYNLSILGNNASGDPFATAEGTNR